MMTSLHIFLLLAALACSASFQVSGFVPHQKDILIRHVVPCHHLTFRPIKPRRDSLHANQEEFKEVSHANDRRGDSSETLMSAQRVMGTLSAAAWILISVTALSYHPDPKFADCTLRHNVLTMSQAFAFQLPVGYATISALSSPDSTHITSTIRRRLNLAVVVASMWLASSTAFASKFAFGYDLYTWKLKAFAAGIHATNGLLALFAWRNSIGTNKMTIRSCASRVIRGTIGSLWSIGPSRPCSDPDSSHLISNNNASIWGLCTAGLLWFTILPIVSPYPLATVPTILGKRLSRPASAFTFLSAVCAFCLKESAESGAEDDENQISRLRKGLMIGSALHLLLLMLKLIGVDGGGLLLPGRGLWEVYPAMLAVPFATASSIIVHALVCFAAL
eukprot:scaffold2644_cov78-Skeletonema_marinoi.AAC.4